MPVLEKYEVQQNRIWYRVEVTEEQKEEYLKWQAEEKNDAYGYHDNWLYENTYGEFNIIFD